MDLNEIGKMQIDIRERRHGEKKVEDFSWFITMCKQDLNNAMDFFNDGHKPNDKWNDAGKPMGISVELADLVIRVAAFVKNHGISMDGAVWAKLDWNAMQSKKDK